MIPVIISGGAGARLWPVSRQSYPKQFCDFLDESLFVKALKRVQPLGSPWTVTVRDLRTLTERALREMAIPIEQTIYEPFGRNTAPALALLCHVFATRGLTDEVVGVFPADQLIGDELAFHAAVEAGVKVAEKGAIVTLGVRPTSPATGYGYIETDGPSKEGTGLRAVKFREKPTAELAQSFIEKGGFYWNAGMFIFRVAKMIEHFKAFTPDIWAEVTLLQSDMSNVEAVYARMRSISIDYAVMERLTEHVCIPCDFPWSDLGSWDALAALMQPSPLEQPVEIESKNNFLFSHEKKSYAFVGVEDLLIVDTQDALLIARKGMSERVKDVVEQLKSQEKSAATQHAFEIRPWGRFVILADSADFKSKTITIDAGAQISYQSHERRSEHWIIVKGAGEVVLDGQTIAVRAGQHIHIPLGAKHRIRNTGAEPLEFVEVQLGSYFGENDITRYADDYQRS